MGRCDVLECVVDLDPVESRIRRVLEVLGHNRNQLVVDAAIMTTWLVVSAATFRWLGLPQWLHYLVLFGGIATYVKLTPDWERPAQDPE